MNCLIRRLLLWAFVILGVADQATSFALGQDEAQCLHNGRVMKQNQIWYVGEAKWQCVRDGYTIKSKIVGCHIRAHNIDLSVDEQRQIPGGKIQTCTSAGKIVTVKGGSCRDASGRPRKLGDIWEGPSSKNMRIRLKCVAGSEGQSPTVIGLGCITNGASSIFIPYGKAVKHRKRYYFCGGQGSPSQPIDWSHAEIPAAFTHCTLSGKKIELLSTIDSNEIRYLCQYTADNESKTTLVPVACLYNKAAYYPGQIRKDAKGSSYRCDNANPKAPTWALVSAGPGKPAAPMPTIPKAPAKAAACTDFDNGCQLLAPFCQVKIPRNSPCCSNATDNGYSAAKAAKSSVIPLDTYWSKAVSEFEILSSKDSRIQMTSIPENQCNCPKPTCCETCKSCNDLFAVQYFTTLVHVLCPKTCGRCAI